MFHPRVARLEIGQRLAAISEPARAIRLPFRHQLCTPGVIDPGDHEAVGGNTSDKAAKGLPKTVRRGVAVRVIPDHIGHHRHVWAQGQKHAIVLVGLEHKEGFATGSGVAVARQLRTDQVADLTAGVAQHLDNHGGGGALAGAAGHGDQTAFGQPDG